MARRRRRDRRQDACRRNSRRSEALQGRCDRGRLARPWGGSPPAHGQRLPRRRPRFHVRGTRRPTIAAPAHARRRCRRLGQRQARPRLRRPAGSAAWRARDARQCRGVAAAATERSSSGSHWHCAGSQAPEHDSSTSVEEGTQSRGGRSHTQGMANADDARPRRTAARSPRRGGEESRAIAHSSGRGAPAASATCC